MKKHFGRIWEMDNDSTFSRTPALVKPGSGFLPIAVCICFAALFPNPALAATSSIPEWYKFDRCCDVQNYLTFEEEVTVESLCYSLNEKYKLTSVVYIDDTLTGMTDEEFADGLAKSWKLGKDSEGRWVVLVMFLTDRKMRLGCSTNLDGKLTNEISTYIIDAKSAPKFKKGDYPGGIRDGMGAIDKALAGNLKIPVGYRISTYFRNMTSNRGGVDLMTVLMIIILITALAGRSRYYYGGYYGGSGYYGGGWFGGGGGFGGGGSSGGGGGGGASGGW